MPNIVTEGFAGANGADLPAGWTGADFMIGDPAGSPNFTIDGSDCAMLKLAMDDELPHFALYTGADATAHHSVTFVWRGQSTNAGRYCSAIARWLDASNFYELRDRNGSAELWKKVAGVSTQIGSTITKATTTHDKNVRLTLTVTGTTLAGRIQRLDDNTYLAAAGTWQVGATDCFSETDSGVAASTPARGGFAMSCANRFDNVLDNVSIDSIVVADPPDAPSGLSVTASGTTGLNISWTDNADNEDGFTVQIDTVNTFDSPDLQEIDVPTADATGAQASNLEPDTTYYVRVLAYNNDGDSDWSSIESATTAAIPPTPGGETGGNVTGWTRGLRFPSVPEPDWVEQLHQIAVADEDDAALILILANL
jgi:hypothetical protein